MSDKCLFNTLFALILCQTREDGMYCDPPLEIKKADRKALRTYRFKNKIYSEMLKLSVAVHLSSAEILTCRLCILAIDVTIETANFM